MHRFTCFLAFATFLLIIVGGLVTSNDYGLAVPDWPKSYGVWMPQMIGGVIYEHGHRMVAATVGFLTVILAALMCFKERRKWVRNLALLAVLAVVLQGVLGGLTVLFLLPTPVSALHATLAQTFFCIVVSLVLFTSEEWQTPVQHAHPGSRTLFVLTTLAIYIQLFLGAWMRHSNAALAIPDFPLAFGRIVPHFTTPEIAIHFAHRIGALVVSLFVCPLVVHVLKQHRQDLKFLRPALVLFALLLIQVTLGGYTVLTKTAVPVATAHVAVGALLLATSLVLTIRSFRYLRPEILGASHLATEPATI